MSKTFYILDGHAQIYRAFYAPFGQLNSPSGEPTRATHVFCNMLFNLIKQRRPDYLAMALDVSDETVFRRELDPEYKANREPPPEGLDVQADRIVQIVTAMGVPIFRLPGFEADDLMATMCERLAGEEVTIFLVSRDKDLEQLITDRVKLYDVSKDEVIDEAILIESKGYTPRQAVEIQSLTGDSTDNVPGVPGIGLKTAAKLIQQYGSAEAVLENADQLTPKMKENVRAYATQLPITRRLVTLKRDVVFDFDLSNCSLDKLRTEPVRPIFDELGFTRLKESLNELGGLFGQSSGYPQSTRKSPVRTGGGAKVGSLFDAVEDEESTREFESDPNPERLPANDEIGIPKLSTERGRYELVDTPEKFAAFLTTFRAQPLFVFDTETTGINPVDAELVGIALSWKSGEAYYLPVRGMMGPVLNERDVVVALKPIFEDAAIKKVGQNIKYDMLMLRQLGIQVRGIDFDTMIAGFLLDPVGRVHSLDAMARSMLGHEMIPITDLIGKGKSQITMDQVDTKLVCEYSGEDADFTWRLMELLAPRMKGSPVERLFREVEMPLVEVLAEMEHNGVALDRKLLLELGESMAGRLEELTRQIHESAGHPFNIDSTKQLATVLFDEQGLTVIKKTKTGRSTDAETLETLAAQTNNAVARLVLEYRELSKLKGTYIDTLPQMVSRKTGRVHAGFHQTGAVTGRLSSSDPNLQNIPIRTEMGRRIRAAFVASRPDTVLLTADYSQIELRILAHFCRDDALIRAFQEGQDIHRAVAAEVNGVRPEDVTPAQRSAAKAVNFGIIYGQTAFGLARGLGISNSEAKSFIDTYFSRYPGIRSFIDRSIEQARKTGYAETILGRRRPIPELQSRNRGQAAFGERIAVNTVVQGSAADLIKRAMIDIHRELKSGGHSARMLIQVHDELVFETDRVDVEREAAMIREKMAAAIPLDVPIVVDISWAVNWAAGKE